MSKTHAEIDDQNLGVVAAKLSPDGSRLAVSSLDSKIRVYGIDETGNFSKPKTLEVD